MRGNLSQCIFLETRVMRAMKSFARAGLNRGIMCVIVILKGFKAGDWRVFKVQTLLNSKHLYEKLRDGVESTTAWNRFVIISFRPPTKCLRLRYDLCTTINQVVI